MRKIYKNFLKEDEVNIITDFYKSKMGGGLTLKINNNKHEVLDSIINKLKDDFLFEVKSQSYWRLESRQSGHPWHRDTGSNNQMPWCQVGVSILLKKGNSGGETYYADDDKETNKIKSNRKLYDLVAHTSDEWHMVTPHEGSRSVLLMFI
tara:strand:- start:3324 stop:3773 length:450 start_codon:yes stop_codon:yes gene_type:complete